MLKVIYVTKFVCLFVCVLFLFFCFVLFCFVFLFFASDERTIRIEEIAGSIHYRGSTMYVLVLTYMSRIWSSVRVEEAKESSDLM